jgi:hypothetical protein
VIALCGRERGIAERESAAIILSAKREGSKKVSAILAIAESKTEI